AHDARLVYRELLSVFPCLDAPRRDGAGPGWSDEALPLPSFLVQHSDPDAVAYSSGLEWICAEGVIDEMAILDIEQHVQHALVHAGENSKSMLALCEMPPR